MRSGWRPASATPSVRWPPARRRHPLRTARFRSTKDLLVSVVSDPEITQSSVQLVGKRAAESNLLVRDYRRSLVERLFEQMFNERFGELARAADARFLSAGIGGGSLTPTVDTFSLSARVPEGGISAGLRAIVSEAKRVREFGFNASELDRAKRSMAAFYERAYNERDKTESGSFAQEYISYFLNGEPSPGIEYEYRLVQQVLPGDHARRSHRAGAGADVR